jgi:hypothetical protein
MNQFGRGCGHVCTDSTFDYTWTLTLLKSKYAQLQTESSFKNSRLLKILFIKSLIVIINKRNNIDAHDKSPLSLCSFKKHDK